MSRRSRPTRSEREEASGSLTSSLDPTDASHGIAPPQRDGRYEKRAQRRAVQDRAQDLACALMQLNAERLGQLTAAIEDLPSWWPELRLAHELPKGGARARQLRYLTRLLRELEADEIQEWLAQLAGLAQDHLGEVAQEQAWAGWRDRLVAAPDEAVEQLCALCPKLDRQQLRSLARQAAKERSQGQTPRAARRLYRVLREQLVAPPALDDGEDGEEATPIE